MATRYPRIAERYDDIAASANGRHVWVVGGGDLAGQFADAGLLDEVWVQYAPVALGAGAPCCPLARPAAGGGRPQP